MNQAEKESCSFLGNQTNQKDPPRRRVSGAAQQVSAGATTPKAAHSSIIHWKQNLFEAVSGSFPLSTTVRKEAVVPMEAGSSEDGAEPSRQTLAGGISGASVQLA